MEILSPRPVIAGLFLWAAHKRPGGNRHDSPPGCVKKHMERTFRNEFSRFWRKRQGSVFGERPPHLPQSFQLFSPVE